jgi:streptogramin lyase
VRAQIVVEPRGVGGVERAAPEITTIAGNGSTSICGDGGPAAAACLGPSARLAVDAADDLYVSTGTRIRRIDAASGRIDPFAGNGSGGYCGDGGPAVDACLSAYDIGVDGDGILFASGSFRLRRVDATTGTIATVAGNGMTGVFCGDGEPAAAACLDSPTAVAAGSGGTVFVLDGGNVVIRRIDAQGAIGSLGAGAPQCPFGLAVPTVCQPVRKSVTVAILTDPAGRLHVVQPSAIWRVDDQTGLVTPIAGGGSGFCGDGGPATAACFLSIGGAAFDAAGNLYIADTGNYRLRRVDGATGIVTTVPVNGSGFYYFAPLTVATDPAGGVYLQNDFDDSLVHVDPATGQSAPVQYDAVPGAPFIECGFNPKMSLATDAAGNLYVADLCTVDRIDVDTRLRYTIAGTGSPFPCGESTDPLATCLSTLGMTVDAAGRIFIADSIGDRLWRVDGADVTTTTTTSSTTTTTLHGCG